MMRNQQILGFESILQLSNDDTLRIFNGNEYSVKINEPSIKNLCISAEILNSYYIPSKFGISSQKIEAYQKSNMIHNDTSTVITTSEANNRSVEHNKNLINSSNRYQKNNNDDEKIIDTPVKSTPIGFNDQLNITTPISKSNTIQNDLVEKKVEFIMGNTIKTPADSITALFNDPFLISANEPSLLDITNLPNKISIDWSGKKKVYFHKHIHIQSLVSETLTVIEKNGKIEKLEVVGTLLGTFCSTDSNTGTFSY